MNNEQSYTEKMKSTAMQNHLGKETFILELYVDMMLKEALLKAEKESLLVKIDDSLDRRDEELFNRYCEDLKKINKQFGS